jgi:IS5 family transposase
MLGKSPVQTTPQMELFRPLLASFINLNHELIQLGNQLDWQGLESHFAPLYSSTGTPSKPIRLIVGLLILKQLYNLSDEKVTEAWVQNPYYQYFTGEIFFSWQLPFAPSDLVHFRHRIGQQGVQKIFEQSVCLFSQDLAKIEVVNVDTTVQEKNITFPTDTNLAVKIIRLGGIPQAKQLAQKEGLRLR